MMKDEMPSDGYASALPIFHTGTSGVEALEAQVDALELALRAAKANLKKARLIKEDDMTNMLWHLMNEHKKIMETTAISASSWCGGIYIPKPAALLVTHSARPASFAISKSFLLSVDHFLPKIMSNTMTADDLAKLDDEHAKFFSTIRQAGIAGALLKQFRGAFSSSQKREDHQHTVFVTGALREQLIYFLSTAPMAFERRINLGQFPLPRMLVAMERFLNMDANLTVDAFRAGFTSLITGTIDEGCHTIMTHKSLRVEEQGTGSAEALAHLAGAGAGPKLWDLGEAELECAKSSKVKLNILQERTDLERSQLRFGAVEWTGRDGEPVTFHRGLTDMFAYAIDSSGKVVASSSATGRAPKITQFKEIAKPAPKRRRKVEDDDETEDEGPQDEGPRYKTDSEEEEEAPVYRSHGGTRDRGGKSASREFMQSRSGRALKRISHDPFLPDLSAPVETLERAEPGIAIKAQELSFGDDFSEGGHSGGGVPELDALLEEKENEGQKDSIDV